VSYSSRRTGFGFGQSSTGDQTRYLNAMGGVGTLFSTVSRISQAVAGVEWGLFRIPTDGRRTTATTPKPQTEITKHPALHVWNHPNPFMSRQKFVEIFSQHVELVGEGYWLPAKDETFPFPTELWPIRPDKMQEVPSAKDFLAGWIYRGPDGEKVPLGVDEIIQLASPNPTNIYRGMGAVQSILTDLDSVRYSAEWNRNFFVNGAQPGGVVEVPETLTDEEFTQFRDRFRAQHHGVANAHKVLMLEGGMSWQDVNYSQKDMQFVELRNVGREVIMESFGIGKTMLGITEAVNRATAEAAELVFAKWLLMSRLNRIKGALNNNFLPLYGPLGEGVEFNFVSPIPEDKDREASERSSKVDAVVKLLEIFEPEEVFEFLGLPSFVLKAKNEPEPASAPNPGTAPNEPEEGNPPADPSEEEGGEE
jgi:HK97 family phage portal protein